MIARTAFCLLAMLLADSSQGYSGERWRITDHTRLDNPERDAARALENNDVSLLGVVRFAIFVPGVDGDYEILRTKYKIKVIPGTSDVSPGQTYNKIAERYAFAYNRYILKKLGCSFKTPMTNCRVHP